MSIDQESNPTKEIENIEPEKPQAKPMTDQEEVDVNAFYAKLNEDANKKSKDFFEYLTTVDEFTYNGQTYKYKMVNRAHMGELRKLIKDAGQINQNENFEEYSINIRTRACLLIQDMTPEKFDAEDSDYELLENIVGAWSIKYRGFRDFKSSVS